MIIFILGFVAGLAAVVIFDLCRYMLMSEKDRFYRNESKKYKDLKVGFVELKGYEE